MKIALVSPYDYAYPGGVNIHISHLSRNFAARGHKVTIIAPSSRPRQFPDPSNGIVLGRPIPIHASGSVVRSPISPGVHFSHKIKRLLREEKFDIIHLHEPLFYPVGTGVLHYSQTVNVGTFHASRSRSWGYWFWRPILNRWFAKLDGKIAVSRSAMEFINKYFPGDYSLIPNGIDLKHFSAEVPPIEQYHDGKLNILFVGRLEKRKGLDHLLKAYHLVKKEIPNTRLIVVGPGGGLRQKRYQWLIAKLGLRDVVFTGFVSYGDLARYYQTADVFCSPAIERESFGIVLLEAMAASKPVVASEIGGYAELISHGTDGLLVSPRDDQALAGSLVQLLEDEPRRQKMGAMGRLKAEQYSWENIAQRVMDCYLQSLNGRLQGG